MSSGYIKRIYRFALEHFFNGLIEGDLEDERFEVKLWAGTVELRDLRLRAEVLDRYLGADSKLRVVEATVRHIQVTIPWTSGFSLASQPCAATITGLSVRLEPVASQSVPPPTASPRQPRRGWNTTPRARDAPQQEPVLPTGMPEGSVTPDEPSEGGTLEGVDGAMLEGQQKLDEMTKRLVLSTELLLLDTAIILESAAEPPSGAPAAPGRVALEARLARLGLVNSGAGAAGLPTAVTPTRSEEDRLPSTLEREVEFTQLELRLFVGAQSEALLRTQGLAAGAPARVSVEVTRGHGPCVVSVAGRLRPVHAVLAPAHCQALHVLHQACEVGTGACRAAAQPPPAQEPESWPSPRRWGQMTLGALQESIKQEVLAGSQASLAGSFASEAFYDCEDEPREGPSDELALELEDSVLRAAADEQLDAVADLWGGLRGDAVDAAVDDAEAQAAPARLALELRVEAVELGLTLLYDYRSAGFQVHWTETAVYDLAEPGAEPAALYGQLEAQDHEHLHLRATGLTLALTTAAAPLERVLDLQVEVANCTEFLSRRNGGCEYDRAMRSCDATADAGSVLLHSSVYEAGAGGEVFVRQRLCELQRVTVTLAAGSKQLGLELPAGLHLELDAGLVARLAHLLPPGASWLPSEAVGEVSGGVLREVGNSWHGRMVAPHAELRLRCLMGGVACKESLVLRLDGGLDATAERAELTLGVGELTLHIQRSPCQPPIVLAAARAGAAAVDGAGGERVFLRANWPSERLPLPSPAGGGAREALGTLWRGRAAGLLAVQLPTLELTAVEGDVRTAAALLVSCIGALGRAPVDAAPVAPGTLRPEPEPEKDGRPLLQGGGGLERLAALSLALPSAVGGICVEFACGSLRVTFAGSAAAASASQGGVGFDPFENPFEDPFDPYAFDDHISNAPPAEPFAYELRGDAVRALLASDGSGGAFTSVAVGALSLVDACADATGPGACWLLEATGDGSGDALTMDRIACSTAEVTDVNLRGLAANLRWHRLPGVAWPACGYALGDHARLADAFGAAAGWVSATDPAGLLGRTDSAAVTAAPVSSWFGVELANVCAGCGAPEHPTGAVCSALSCAAHHMPGHSIALMLRGTAGRALPDRPTRTR
jgi:hypothetical protein